MGKQPVRTLLYGGLFLLFLLSLTGCSSAADTITAQDAAPPPGDAWKTPSEEVNAAIEGLVYPGEAVLMGYGQELEGAVGTTYTVSLRVPEEMAIVSTYYQELLQGLPGYHRTQRSGPGQKADFFNAVWSGSDLNLQVTPDKDDPAYTTVVVTLGTRKQE